MDINLTDFVMNIGFTFTKYAENVLSLDWTQVPRFQTGNANEPISA